MTFEKQAEQVLDAIRQYLETTARAHQCAGWNCKLCSIWGDRYEELKKEIIDAL